MKQPPHPGHPKHSARPVPPFKDEGTLQNMGWDIETCYVIDAHGHCWIDNAHGHPVQPCTNDQLISAAADSGEHRQNGLRKILNMRIPDPEWMRIARARGWTPPPAVDPAREDRVTAIHLRARGLGIHDHIGLIISEDGTLTVSACLLEMLLEDFVSQSETDRALDLAELERRRK